MLSGTGPEAEEHFCVCVLTQDCGVGCTVCGTLTQIGAEFKCLHPLRTGTTCRVDSHLKIPHSVHQPTKCVLAAHINTATEPETAQHHRGGQTQNDYQRLKKTLTLSTRWYFRNITVSAKAQILRINPQPAARSVNMLGMYEMVRAHRAAF